MLEVMGTYSKICKYLVTRVAAIGLQAVRDERERFRAGCAGGGFGVPVRENAVVAGSQRRRRDGVAKILCGLDPLAIISTARDRRRGNLTSVRDVLHFEIVLHRLDARLRRLGRGKEISGALKVNRQHDVQAMAEDQTLLVEIVHSAHLRCHEGESIQHREIERAASRIWSCRLRRN